MLSSKRIEEFLMFEKYYSNRIKTCVIDVFEQDIYRAEDERLCVKAVVECVCVIKGRLGTHEMFDKILE